MTDTASVSGSTAPMSGATTTPKPRSHKRRLLALTVVALVVVLAAMIVTGQPLTQRVIGSLLRLASPLTSSTSSVQLNVQIGPRPLPTPAIESTHLTLRVPATGTQEVRLVLKRGDQLVGIYKPDHQVDFSLWLLTVPRQRLIQQVQVQDESTFAWTAQQSGDYLLLFASPRNTDVAIAYAIRGPLPSPTHP